MEQLLEEKKLQKHEIIVKQHCTRLIIPFAYKQNYSEIEQLLNKEFFTKKSPSTERLFDHVHHLISKNDYPETIGKYFLFNHNARTKVGLPNNVNKLIHYVYSKETYCFYVKDIELYLFETNIGLLVIDIDYPSNHTFQQLIEANYYIKKYAKMRNTKIFFERRISKDQIVEQELDFIYLIEKLVGNLQITSFFDGADNRAKQALMYSSVVVDHSTEEMKEDIPAYLFRLKRGFRESYKPEIHFQNQENSEILSMFDNSFWGVSLEGIGNIVTLTNDDVTDHFFQTNYTANIRNTYFYLYILALQQKYSLLNLMRRVTEIPQKLKRAGKNYELQFKIINQYKSQIVSFMLRNSYKQVSNITHHADLYELIYKRLRIEDLFNELHDELNTLLSLTEINEQKQKERFNWKLSILTAVFLPVTVAAGILGGGVPIFTESMDKNLSFLLLSAIGYSISIPILFWKSGKD